MWVFYKVIIIIYNIICHLNYPILYYGMWIMLHVQQVKFAKMRLWIVCGYSTLHQCTVEPIYTPRLGVSLQVYLHWASMHPIWSIFTQRPFQISPVQHSQFLNWVQDSKEILYWTYGSGAKPNTVRQVYKRHSQTIFRGPGVKRCTRNDQFHLWKLCENLFLPSLR